QFVLPSLLWHGILLRRRLLSLRQCIYISILELPKLLSVLFRLHLSRLSNDECRTRSHGREHRVVHSRAIDHRQQRSSQAANSQRRGRFRRSPVTLGTKRIVPATRT